MNVRTEPRGYRLSAIAFAAFAGGLLTSHTSTASRGPNTDNVTVVVRYDDLNVHSANGKDALLRRISLAVERVCRGPAHYRERSWRRTYEHCRRESLKSALAQVPSNVVGESAGAGLRDDALSN